MSCFESPPLLVRTVGHSRRTLEELIALLEGYRITNVMDVRKMPRSATNPQFNIDTLPHALEQRSIQYKHLPELGGLRRPRPGSVNTGWHNASFQGYADYMQTLEFAAGLEVVLVAAKESDVVLMCAEAVPWRCHRSLIADALVVRGVRVEHILGLNRSQEHVLRPWAHVEQGRISYPPSAAS